MDHKSASTKKEKSKVKATSTTTASNATEPSNIGNFFNIQQLRLDNGVCPNFIQYRDQLYPIALSQCGQVATIIKTDTEFTPKEIELPDEVLNKYNDPFKAQRLELQQRIKDRCSEINTLNSVGKPKLFGLIWGSMSQDSRNKVIECQVAVDPMSDSPTYHNDWSDVEATSDSTRLWNRIRLTHVGINTTIKVLDQSKSKDNYERVHQYKTEQLFAYRDRFKFALDTLKLSGATVETEEEQAVRFAKGLDNARYAQFRADLTNSATRGTADYPPTYEEVYDLASKFKVVSSTGQVVEAAAFITSNNTKKESKDKDSKGNRKKSNRSSAQTSETGGSDTNRDSSSPCNKSCPICQAEPPTHWQRDCPIVQRAKKLHEAESKRGKNNDNKDKKEASVNLTFARVTVCTAGNVLHEYQVGEPIPLKDHCVDPAINLFVSFKASNYPSVSKNHILLDNQANVSIFSNERLLHNIRPAKVPCHVNGINSDGTPIIANLVGDYSEHKGIYYHPDASANILSFSDTCSYCHNLYDPVADVFTSTTPSGITHVFELVDGLYAYHDMPDSVVLNSVATNQQAFTKRQIKDAESARELIRRLAIPSENAAISAINNGSIINSSVTAHDIHRAAQIYGKDISALRGKSHKRPSKPINNESLPRQVPSDVVFNTDIMFCAGHAFLVSVLTPIGITLCNHLGNSKGSRSTPTVKKALNTQLSETQRRKFTPVALNTDGEGAVHALAVDLGVKGIKLNPTGAGAHVHVVERKIEEIKERARGILNTLPFKLALTLVVWLILFCVSRINLIPHKGGPIGIAPSEAFNGRKTNADIDLRVGFGDYCECVDPYSDNTMRSRTQAAIALLPSGNLTGSVIFFCLATGRTMRRDQFTILPMPDIVIAHLNKMAELSYAKSNQGPDAPVLNFAMAADDNPISTHPADDTDGSLYDPPLIDITADELLPNPDVVLEEHSADFGPTSPLADSMLPAESPAPTDQSVAPDEPSVDSDITSRTPDDPLDVALEQSTDPVDDTVEQPSVTNSDTSTSSASSTRPFTRSSVRGAPDTSIIERARLAAIKRNTWYCHNRSRAYHNASVLHVSVNKAMKAMPKAAIKSMFKEVGQMIDKAVFKGVAPSFKHQKKVIKSFMFLKEKFDSSGQFDKLKARLVAGGHMQDRTFMTEDDSSSPTASLSSIFTIAAIAARDGRHIRTSDITGAYLNADISDKEILMELDETVSAILVAIDPSYKQFMRPNGTIVVELQKALYGCVESGKLWYDLLSSCLKSIGYVQNAIDQCVFNKTVNGKQCTVAVYVDDLFISSQDLAMIDELELMLVSQFKSIEIHDGPIYSYLGMSWDYTVPGEVKVTMEGFVEDLLTWSEIEGTVATPAANHLFEVRNADKLPKDKVEVFHSASAKLLYLSKRVRPDIILAVSFLTTRVQSPDSDDWSKLQRVLKYLNGTRDFGIVLRPNKTGQQVAFIDASYGIHQDGKSHSGLVISLGLGPLLVKSSKQKIVTKSSTEAELIALSDLCSLIIWNREFLTAQGENPPPAIVNQDNQSTMALTNRGASTSERTRHIKIRHFWVKDQIDNGEIEIVYTPTEDMVADILTKPLQGESFFRLRQLLLNWSY